MSNDRNSFPSCPLPVNPSGTVRMAHGAGGEASQKLLRDLILPAFDNPTLARAHDGAVLQVGNAKLAFTTDAFVVTPLFFPGGDIGTLAVNGTVNDLAMCGARPIALSASFILEEGLPLETLQRVIASMQKAALAAGVYLVTGDTKVVEAGHGDGIYITTSGIGIVAPNVDVAPQRVRPGDVVLLSGDIASHGIAVLAAREGLQFETPVSSDTAPLAQVVMRLIENGVDLHCLRDPTRGGVASSLIEIAADARVAIELDEAAVSVSSRVRGACELLGIDPLHVANEGRFIAFVDPSQVELALRVMADDAACPYPCVIGRVSAGFGVTLRTSIGSRRPLDALGAEQLPRIC